jgi:hypothetical protein
MENKDFVQYSEALELKQLGFDELCFGWYDCYSKMVNYEKAHNSCGWLNGNHCSAPTYSQAFRWFREKHGIDGMPYKSIEGSYYHWITKVGGNRNNQYEFYNKGIIYYKTYEEAEQSCLIRLIEIVKENKK